MTFHATSLPASDIVIFSIYYTLFVALFFEFNLHFLMTNTIKELFVFLLVIWLPYIWNICFSALFTLGVLNTLCKIELLQYLLSLCGLLYSFNCVTWWKEVLNLNIVQLILLFIYITSESSFVPLWFQSPPYVQFLVTTDLNSVTIILPFSECHTNWNVYFLAFPFLILCLFYSLSMQL